MFRKTYSRPNCWGDKIFPDLKNPPPLVWWSRESELPLSLMWSMRCAVSEEVVKVHCHSHLSAALSTSLLWLTVSGERWRLRTDTISYLRANAMVDTESVESRERSVRWPRSAVDVDGPSPASADWVLFSLIFADSSWIGLWGYFNAYLRRNPLQTLS